MASKLRNPVVSGYKYARNERAVKENAHRERNVARKDARANELTKRRNIKEKSFIQSESKAGLSVRDDNVQDLVQGILADTCSQQNGKIKQVKSSAIDKRKQQMLEWKTKRDQKRQIDAKKYKSDQFVVKHVIHSPPRYLIASKKKLPNTEAKPTAVSRPMTRQYAKQHQIPCSGNKNRITEKPKRGVANRQTRTSKTCKKLPSTEGEGKLVQHSGNAPVTAVSSNNPSKTSGYCFEPNHKKKIPTKFSFQDQIPFKDTDKDQASCGNNSNCDSKQLGMKEIPAQSTQASSDSTCEESRFVGTTIRDIEMSLPVEEQKSRGNIAMSNSTELRKVSAENGGFEADITKHIVTSQHPLVASELDSKSLDPNQNPVTPRNLRNTPARRAAKTPQITPGKAKDSSTEIENSPDIVPTIPEKSWSISTIGKPGKTPKRLRNIPMHLNDTLGNGGFTPRRLQSTAHFNNLVNATERKLLGLNDSWNTVLEANDLTDEVSGKIRTVVGQSQLLMNQRFKQFQDLIEIHQSKSADKDATATDLQGFWDMIFYQVEDVYKKFDDLKRMKENNWNDERTENVRKTNKVIKKKLRNTSNPVLTARQEEMRKFKLAMKAKMNAAKNEANKAPEEFVVNSNDEDKNAHQEDALAFSKYLRPSVSETNNEDDLLGLGMPVIKSSLEQIEDNMAGLIMDSAIDQDRQFDSPLIKF